MASEPCFVARIPLRPPSHIEVDGDREARSLNGGMVRADGLELFLHTTRPRHEPADDDGLRRLAQQFRERGSACLAEVDDPFAVIVWEPDRSTLTLARDLAGRSCLYYVVRDGGAIVSNRLDRLVEKASLGFRISDQALDFYWALGFIPAPHCIVEGVRKVSAGTAVVVADGAIRTSAFLPLPEAPAACSLSADEIVDGVEQRLTRSLETVTAGTERVCILLSGGVDSSLLAALLARIGRTDVVAASVVAGVEDASDRAARIAASLGLRHHALRAPTFSFERLADVLAHIDEPCSDTMSLPLAQLLQGASSVADLCLSGIGADSLFCGLNSHLALDQADRGYQLPMAAQQQLGPRAAASVAADLDVLRSATDLATGWGRMFESMSADDRVALAGREVDAASIDAAAPAFVRAWCGTQCNADRLARFDAEVPMADSTLQLVRQTANFAGIAHDSPFLSADFYAFTRQLPRDRLIQDGVGKAPLRQLVQRLLPAESWRLPKIGFRLPLVAVLEQGRSAVEDIVRSVDTDRVSPPVLRRWVDEFFGSASPRSFFAARRIWRVLIWELWRRTHSAR